MTIFILLLAFQLKHFVADYPLQGKYMLKKFLPGTEWILPLLAHASVHAGFTFAITWLVLCFKPYMKPSDIHLLWQLPLFDLVVHFVMDRIKASPSLLGRFKALSANDFRTLAVQKSEMLRLAPDGHYEIRKIDRKFQENTYFWWALGLDQSVHHLTHYVIIAALVGVI